jgi:hypothetical protein
MQIIPRLGLLILLAGIKSDVALTQTATPPVAPKDGSLSTPTNGATLEDTAKFIDSLTRAQSPVLYETVTDSHDKSKPLLTNRLFNYRRVQIVNCNLSIEYNSTSASGPWDSWSVPLQRLDPLGVRIVTWSTSENRNNILNGTRQTMQTIPELYKVEPLYLAISDKSQAERVAKALIHAIVLCGGGKGEAF